MRSVVWEMPQNNNSPAVPQITEAKWKHICSLLFCQRVATSPCDDDINDKSPHESEAFQFSLTLRGVSTSLCRPGHNTSICDSDLTWYIRRQTYWLWIKLYILMIIQWDVHTLYKKEKKNIVIFQWVTHQIHSCSQAGLTTPWTLILMSRRVPGGQRDHYFLLHPKGHLLASPTAEHHWHTWSPVTHPPPSWRSWNKVRLKT